MCLVLVPFALVPGIAVLSARSTHPPKIFFPDFIGLVSIKTIFTDTRTWQRHAAKVKGTPQLEKPKLVT